MEPVPVSFTVNGHIIRDQVDAEMTLLTYLRQNLGLTGSKRGCGRGQCGTCTVLLNGRAVKSCVIKLKSPRLKDARIETIESLAAPGGALHPIQEAFVRSGALQCGFCTPGMIMSVKGLLLENPGPDRDAIQHYLKSRNLCRCTGYQKIFTAVDQAAKVMNGAQTGFSELPNDTPLRVQEAVRKVTGSLKYADDITWDNMLVGKILFAEQAPSVLTEIDCSAVTGLAGIAGVITAEDIRGSRRTGLVDRDQPALIAAGDTIRTIADPLGAVFAQTAEQAEAALSTITVTCRNLPGVYTTDAAEQPGAALVWADKPGNLFYQGRIERGDMAETLQQAELVVSGNFSTSRIAHGFLEPESGLARPDGSGGVEIHYPSQTVFDDQIQVADVLGMPRQQVRVVQLPTGGAFGGKEDLVFQHILALAALKFQRPVKITLTRDESLRVSQKKHPMDFQARLAINREGLFQGLDVEVAADKGAYASLGFDIIENAMAFVGGPYFIPSVRINGRSVYTHNVMSGAMRGFGANQGNFVIESLVDMAARELGMDPFEIRFINALRPGLPTVTDHVLEPGIAGIEETLLAAREAWQRETPPTPSPGKRLGMGIACGVKNVGFGHGLPESAGARVELKDDGSCHLFVTHHEYGQGAVIGQARIASEILGIPLEKIIVSSPDTSLTPYTGASTASRQTFLSGNATLGACRQLKSELFELAATRLSVLDPASLKLEGDHIVTMDGRHRLPLADLGSTFTAEFRAFPPETEGLLEDGQKSPYGSPAFSSRRTHWAYAYGVQIVWVEVDENTGAARVLKVITAGDVGRVLNRRAIEGQQEGGVVMGIGYALSEEFQVEQGHHLTRSLKQCGLPTAADAPEIVSVIVEVPHPWGPLGVKGLAEAPSLATAPAVANAVFDAIGVRLFHLPMTAERIKQAITEKAQ